MQGSPALRKAVTTHVKKYDLFSRVFDIANQLLTRLSSIHDCLSEFSRIMAAPCESYVVISTSHS